MSDCPAKNPAELEALFPAWAVEPQRVETGECCGARPTPMDVAPMLVRLIREFVDDPKISVTTRANAAETTLPRVVVERTGTQLQELGIHDRVGFEPHSGTDSYITNWASEHVISCVGGTYREAEQFGAAIALHLHHHTQDIRALLQLDRFRVTSIGGVSSISLTDGSTGTYGIQIGVSSVMRDRWSVTPAAPRIKRININPQNY